MKSSRRKSNITIPIPNFSTSLSDGQDGWSSSPLRPVLLPFRSDRNLGLPSIPAAAASVPSTTPITSLGSSYSSSSGNVTRSAAISLAADEDAELPSDFAASAFGVATSTDGRVSSTSTTGLISGLAPGLIHISFPSTLPFKRRRVGISESESHSSSLPVIVDSGKGVVESGFVSSDSNSKWTPRCSDGLFSFEIPEGVPFGKLQIHASGKVNMEIGGLLFDITNGLRRQEYEEIIATVGDEDTLVSDSTTSGSSPAHYVVLGKVTSTVIVTPSLESMVRDMDAETETKTQRLVREYFALGGETSGSAFITSSTTSNRRKR